MKPRQINSNSQTDNKWKINAFFEKEEDFSLDMDVTLLRSGIFESIGNMRNLEDQWLSNLGRDKERKRKKI